MKLIKILTSFFFLFGSITLAVYLSFNLRFIYPLLYDLLDLESTEISKEIAVLNFNHVIDYLRLFSTSPLEMEGLELSENGLSHFYDVKVLLSSIYIFGIVNSILFVSSLIFQKKRYKRIDFSFLTIPKFSVIIFFLIIFICGFDRVFYIFHLIAFRNSDWQFSTNLDQIINVLPQDYFFIMAMILGGIVLLIIIGGEIIYRLLKRKKIKKELESLS